MVWYPLYGKPYAVIDEQRGAPRRLGPAPMAGERASTSLFLSFGRPRRRLRAVVELLYGITHHLHKGVGNCFLYTTGSSWGFKAKNSYRSTAWTKSRRSVPKDRCFDHVSLVNYQVSDSRYRIVLYALARIQSITKQNRSSVSQSQNIKTNSHNTFADQISSLGCGWQDV